jgi:hypothetical protein
VVAELELEFIPGEVKARQRTAIDNISFERRIHDGKKDT